MNAFVICEGERGGLIAVYNAAEYSKERLIAFLQGDDYTEFHACGTIDKEQRELRFEHPADSLTCKEWLENAAENVDVLRHYGDCIAFGPRGERFGSVKTFCPES